MRKKQNKKYPLSLFMLGFFMNLISNFLMFLAGVVFLIVGIFVKFCLYVGIVLLLIDVIAAFIEQLVIRNTTLHSDNPEFSEWQDAILSPDWMENIKQVTESKMSDAEDEESDKLD